MGNTQNIPTVTRQNECFYCESMRTVPGNCHIKCTTPDPKMTGNQHGIDSGWFIYPTLFDPTWKTKPCVNFTPATGVAVLRKPEEQPDV